MDTNGTRYLTTDQIFAADDIEERDVSVPQWPGPDGQPGKVRIRTFTKRQINKMNRDATRTNPKTGQPDTDTDRLEALMFIEGVVEPKFDLISYQKLLEKSAAAVLTIQMAITEASGLSEVAVKAAAKSAEKQSDDSIRVPPGARAWYDAAGVVASDERG